MIIPKKPSRLYSAIDKKDGFLVGKIKANFIKSFVQITPTDNKNNSILDLSCFSVKNFKTYSDLGYTNIYFSDFFDSTDSLFFKEDHSLNEEKLFEQFFGKKNKKEVKKFDVVLGWDVLNYLPKSNLKTFTDFLFKYTTRSANLFALIYTQKTIPSEAFDFELDIAQLSFEAKNVNKTFIDAQHQITTKKLQSFFTPWYLNKISLCHGYIHDVHFIK